MGTADREPRRGTRGRHDRTLRGLAVALVGAVPALYVARTLTRTQQQLDAARLRIRDLEAASRRRQHAMATAVHELRTPLATVRGFLETLAMRRDQLDDDTRDHLVEIATRNAVLLGQRIDTMLEFERLSSDAIALEVHPVRLDEVVPRLLEDVAGLLDRHDVRTQLPDDLWVLADEDALAHILSNLLGNAAKHSSAGTTITVGATTISDAVELQVVDHGDGIAPDDLPHVFTPFYRSVGQEVDGAGIGLAVVARYADLLDADVDIDSTVGEGTTVTLTLPTAAAPLDVERPTVERS